jgi:hypothetical protein
MSVGMLPIAAHTGKPHRAVYPALTGFGEHCRGVSEADSAKLCGRSGSFV